MDKQRERKENRGTRYTDTTGDMSLHGEESVARSSLSSKARACISGWVVNNKEENDGRREMGRSKRSGGD